MDFRFSTMPQDRKIEVARVFDRWKKTGHGVDVLQESLRVLATSGRMEEFRRLRDDGSERASAIVNIAFTHALNYQAKGVLSQDDAQRVLEVIQETRQIVPSPPAVTKSVLERVAAVLFEESPRSSASNDALAHLVSKVLLQIEPAAMQETLF